MSAIQVVAALIVQGGRLLICQRKGGPFAAKWEFPGGKVEPGEGLDRALFRELKEELDIDVSAAREVFRHRHRYGAGRELDLSFFRVDEYRGAIVNRIFQDVRWVEAAELKSFDFLDGDRPLIEKLATEGLPQ
ncbi:MAG TPA: (deoxy)nucleoside triphosphate pyrophosphohydrolase [Verrucomicrobiae bacterium]|nr:(deoxy)nucleoside triphosphate pyrophosphohydrolase [Verrucomicrobiae bacterium]